MVDVAGAVMPPSLQDERSRHGTIPTSPITKATDMAAGTAGATKRKRREC